MSDVRGRLSKSENGRRRSMSSERDVTGAWLNTKGGAPSDLSGRLSNLNAAEGAR